MSNSLRESSKGLKPHSYAVSFSKSAALTETTKDRKKIIEERKL